MKYRTSNHKNSDTYASSEYVEDNDIRAIHVFRSPNISKKFRKTLRRNYERNFRMSRSLDDRLQLASEDILPNISQSQHSKPYYVATSKNTFSSIDNVSNEQITVGIFSCVIFSNSGVVLQLHIHFFLDNVGQCKLSIKESNSWFMEQSSLGEVLVSLCHNPSKGLLTIKILHIQGLKPISKNGTISKFYCMKLHNFTLSISLSTNEDITQ